MKRLVMFALTVSLILALLFAGGCKKKQTKASFLPQPSAVLLA
ncbi:MAG: hypothetical protein N3B10_00950 [Armatimonadetes bacterium]|nr:hypothetical protein [Armatimonadota bacterium]MCX7967037.1 hypothetical protein [Armatimonadota bacterium]MDW8144034.1 hypothetical protein [Armatimonadota bacterium]